MALIEWLRYRLPLLRMALTIQPIRGGSPEGDDTADDAKDDTKDAADDAKDDAKDDGKDDADKVDKDDNWQTKSRKNERLLKAERKKREAAEQRARELEDADKSEQQKAIDAAREEGKTAAQTEGQKERRHDRLEAKCVTVAARGIKVGEGDDAKTLKFADPDDALVYIERAVREGDVAEDEIFDSEGKVNTDALTTELANLLERKPHLQAGETKQKPADSDARKGDSATGDLEAMSIEEHEKRKYPQPK